MSSQIQGLNSCPNILGHIGKMSLLEMNSVIHFYKTLKRKCLSNLRYTLVLSIVLDLVEWMPKSTWCIALRPIIYWSCIIHQLPNFCIVVLYSSNFYGKLKIFDVMKVQPLPPWCNCSKKNLNFIPHLKRLRGNMYTSIADYVS